MKFIKKVLIIILILLIDSISSIYKIIQKFWIKNNGIIKEFVKNLDKGLREELL